MSELFKLLKKKTAKVEQVSPAILLFEETYTVYNKEILPLISPNYEIGIEIEVERVLYPDSVLSYPVWSGKEDHSLRDHGIEYVSVPIKGNRIHYALNALYSLLPGGYRFSPRTSIHVHLNVLDMTTEKIAVLCAAYALTEPLLYKFVGGERDKSNFAVPFKDADAYDLIEYFLDEKINFNLENYRYLGLNIDSIRKFGSLEFRHLGGTDDKIKIIKWINLIFCLKKYAHNTSWAQMKYHIDRLNTDSSYFAIVDAIYGDRKADLNTKNLSKEMEHAAACLKRLKLVNPLFEMIRKEGTPLKHFWYQKVCEIKKKSTNEFVFQREANIQQRNAPGRREAMPAPNVQIEMRNPFRPWALDVADEIAVEPQMFAGPR